VEVGSAGAGVHARGRRARPGTDRRAGHGARGDGTGRHAAARPGPGPALRERLFEPFVTSKPAGRGTGLGLPISRRIVQECGGSLEVRSEPGRGTCFTVTLRAEAEDAG